jgi:cell division septation protein DedD
MPDQYDPKLSPRPSADRRQAGRGNMADDPLAELAKIVQGRPSTGGPLQAARQAAQAAPAPSNGADLEAELLNDLQASFAAVRDVFPSAPPPAPATKQPAPQPAPPAMQPRPAIVDEPPPPVQVAPAPAAAPPPRGEPHPELRDEFRLEPIDERRLVPIPSAPVIQPMIQTSAEPPPPPRIIERRAEPAAEKPAPEPVVERPAARPRTPPAAPDLGAFQLRGSAAPSPTAPAAPSATPPRQPHSRWERPEVAKPQPAVASRFAPPRTAVPQIEDEPDLDPFAEGGLFADQLEPPEAEEEFPLEDLGTLPGYAEDEQLPPLEDELDGLPPRRGFSRNLVVIAAVVAVALVGGIGFAMFNGNSGTSGTPPVIAADGKPTKITPDDTTAANDTDGQNKLIYDRVNSADQANSDTTLLTPDNGPIKDVASNSGNGAISRVIIPGGPGIDAPGTGDAAATGQQAAANSPDATDPVGQLAANDASVTDPDSIQPIGPKKVRTVVVKPDGTIVYSTSKDAEPAPGATAPSATTAADATQPAATGEKPAVTDDVAAIAGNGADALPITAPAADGTAANASVDAAAPAAVTTPPAAAAPPAATAAVKPAPAKPAAKPAAKPDTTEVASADDNASPIDIVPGATPPPATSGVLVQISSQRTEDAARATYRDLQARYPNILGSYDVNVQRADLPDRGTFYRVRVGPFSQNDAQRLCDDLRQAGGDCVLVKR